tara:strand:- start:259 stop:732 length:474 start_codon:yes stop_codon:yes gene_type:complete
MAFGTQQISPIDLNKSAAVGVNIPFTGLGSPIDLSTSGSLTFPQNNQILQTPFCSNYTTSDAIKNNLINFFLTNPGERPLNPDFGGGLRNFIFEQITDNNLDGLEDIISSKLGNYFPSVLIQSLELTENSNNNEITLFLKYSIANTNSTDNLELNFT